MSVLNINSGIHAGGHASPRKVCDENKRKKESTKKEKENDGRVKFFYWKEDFIRLYQKTGWSDFDELWVTDSTLNESTNSLINERKGRGRWFVVHCRKTSAIKLAMADTQEWRQLFTSLLVY